MGPAGQDGEDGDPGENCTVTNNGDGTATLTCPDGSETLVPAIEEELPSALRRINGNFTATSLADIEYLQPVETITAICHHGQDLRMTPHLKRGSAI